MCWMSKHSRPHISCLHPSLLMWMGILTRLTISALCQEGRTARRTSSCLSWATWLTVKTHFFLPWTLGIRCTKQKGKCNWDIVNPHLPFCLLGDGELVEQVLGQQTGENRESLLDNLIRQLQNEQDERHNTAQQAEEAEGMEIMRICMDFFTKYYQYVCYHNKPFSSGGRSSSSRGGGGGGSGSVCCSSSSQERAGGWCVADAAQCSAQSSSHRERPAGLEPQSHGQWGATWRIQVRPLDRNFIISCTFFLKHCFCSGFVCMFWLELFIY